MPIQFSPDDFQNNDFQLAQNNAGDLVLEHKQTGGRFKFDATTDSWVPVQGLDLQGADIVNVGASKTNFTEKADLTSSNGVLQSSQLPDLAITNIDVVANQSERLSLKAEEGDVAVQTDVSQTFILATNDPTVDSNWKQVQLDVLGAIDGQTITPAQTGTSTNPTDVEAGNIEAGTIGSSGSRPDLIADDVSPRSIADDYLYAGEFSGGSPDSRLDSCLNAASIGTTIYLEAGNYTKNRTITTPGLDIIGAGGNRNGTAISATITLDGGRVHMRHVTLRDSSTNLGEIILNGGQFARHLVMGTTFGDVTINSGTETSIVAFTRDTTVTDNGTNNQLIGVI